MVAAPKAAIGGAPPPSEAVHVDQGLAPEAGAEAGVVAPRAALATAAGLGQAVLLATALFVGGSTTTAWLLVGALALWAASEAAVAPPSRVIERGGWLPGAQSAAMFAALWVALAVPAGAASAPALLLGLACVLGGTALRVAAIRTLGPLFLDAVTLAHDHPRIRRGVYKRLRHPALAGAVLICAGTALATGSLAAGALILGTLLPLATYRALREERLFRARRAT